MKFLLFILLTIFINSFSSASVSSEGIKYFKSIGKAFTEIAKITSPAVVFIETEKTQQISGQLPFYPPFKDMDSFPFGDDILKHFFENRIPRDNRQKERTQKISGQGSGFIISKDGYIMSNNHVVGDAEKVVVKLLDGRSFVAKVIGTDQHSDIAVLKIKAKGLTPLPFGNSDLLEVGEWVIALGNPFGLKHTLTAGVVSAKGRNSIGITDYENFIQTDAAINLGNSGGPLINLDGEAVGMSTAIISRTGGSMGIGFAIPINMLKEIKNQLIKKGYVTRGYLGILIQNLTTELAEQFNIKNPKGILVSDVTDNSPAQKSGIKTGDIIIKIDGKEVNEVGAFRNRIALTPPGKRKRLTLIRNGKEKIVKVKIEKLPSDFAFSRALTFKENDFGFSVENLTSLLRKKYGFSTNEKGVIISEVNPHSVAAIAGLKTGMLIKEVNQIKIKSVAEFKNAAKRTKRKNTILLLLQDGEFSRYVTLSIN